MSEPQRQRVGPIGKILYEAGVVTREQVTEALELQRAEGGKTFEILVRKGYLNKDDLHRVLSQLSGVATIALERVNLSPDLLKLVPKELALQELVLPVDQLGKLLTVAMACPIDVDTIERIEQLTGLRVKAMLCRYDDVYAAVEKFYPDPARQGQDMPTFEMPRNLAEQPGKNLTEEVKRLDAVAVAPGLLDKLMAAAQGNNADLRACVQTASADPALAGWLLAFANSPAFGMPGQVESLGLAFALMGGEGLRAALEDLKSAAPQPKADFGAVYTLARRGSVAAALLAKKTGKVDRTVAYTAALLRPLGWFALATLAPVDALGVLGEKDESARCALERKRLGLSHLEAGAILANRWRLPRNIVLATTTPYADAAAQEDDLTPLTSLASILAAGAAQGANCLDGHQALLARVGLTAETAYREVEKAFAEG